MIIPANFNRYAINIEQRSSGPFFSSGYARVKPTDNEAQHPRKMK